MNVGNVGRAIPTFGLLIIFASWSTIGVGDKAAILALAIFAIPPLLTNAYVGMRGVDPDVKDAARGMGMTGGQLIRKVELPLAVPLIFGGIRTATVQVVATATLAAVVAGGGLGRYIVDGRARRTMLSCTAGWCSSSRSASSWSTSSRACSAGSTRSAGASAARDVPAGGVPGTRHNFVITLALPSLVAACWG